MNAGCGYLIMLFLIFYVNLFLLWNATPKAHCSFNLNLKNKYIENMNKLIRDDWMSRQAQNDSSLHLPSSGDGNPST